MINFRFVFRKEIIMLVKVFSAAVYGIEAQLITIEVSISRGIKYYMVGLPDIAVKESLQRIECAVTAFGLKMPRQRIVVNLAPAYIRKEGSVFDLAIAMGILAASGQCHPQQDERFMFFGELALDGGLLPIRGVLSMVLCAKKNGFSAVVVPAANFTEAKVVEGIKVYAASSLQQVIQIWTGMPSAVSASGTPVLTSTPVRTAVIGHEMPDESLDDQLDFSDVKGQEHIKRALEVVAAGGHNVLMVGPPGAGKSLLARLLPTILPPLSHAEALETTQIYSVSGKLKPGQAILHNRPFREPHHTITQTALIGGGSFPQPGEISLAHNGVLFLDELPEFKRPVLEVLRQPLESRTMTITRAKTTSEFPADFILVAAMNPCPCGYYHHPDSGRECQCGAWNISKYMNRVSAPLLDRIDIHLDMAPVSFSKLMTGNVAESSAEIRGRVVAARQIQQQRFSKLAPRIQCNAQMNHRQIQQFCPLQSSGLTLLGQAMERLGLSMRAYDRIIKVARTVADLSGSSEIEEVHLAEAIQYRTLDRPVY